MPPRRKPRPGLELLAQQGEEWERLKVADLTSAFGLAAVLAPAGGATRHDLDAALSAARPGSFIAQADYALGPAFDAGLGCGITAGLGVGVGRVRPDLIEVLPPGATPTGVTAVGEPFAVAPGDDRLGLRVIDIKLTSSPGVGYFAEVALYMASLAGWLVDRGLDSRYVVSADGAVWPGSYEESALQREASSQRKAGSVDDAALRRAMAEDLEAVPLEVFSLRLLRFFGGDIPRVLAADWRSLDWHVDNRCKGCDFLGDDRGAKDPADGGHCMPLAYSTDALSRVAFLSRGASRSLRDSAVSTVAELSSRSAGDPAFDTHHTLRAGRNVVAGRASSLVSGTASIPASAGSSALLPRHSNLSIYVSADFDLGSAMTIAFGCSAFWGSSSGWTPPASDPSRAPFERWKPMVHLVAVKKPERERDELFNLLDSILKIIDKVNALDPNATVQVYVWDDLQYKHLARVIGRHLDALLAMPKPMARLAWLFPPDDVISNADMILRQSHVTIVRDVVRSLLAAPIAHYYNLLEVARQYQPTTKSGTPLKFSVHPLYEDPLSDQIPSERAHDIWANHPMAGMDWSKCVATYRETVERRLEALEAVTRALQGDPNLKPSLLHSAPRADIKPLSPLRGAAVDSQLWWAYANLNAALAALEREQFRAMSADEREARYEAARLTRRLAGGERAAAVARLKPTPGPTAWVYEMAPGSTEVKIRDGDFRLALSPRSDATFLDRKLSWVLGGHPITATLSAKEQNLRMRHVALASVVCIDRDAGLVALEPDGGNGGLLVRLDSAGAISLANEVMLDQLPMEFLLKKLAPTLRRIGNPASAARDPLALRALGLRPPGPGRTPTTPASEALWEPARLASEATPRDVTSARAALEAGGVSLNPSQWSALEEAVSHRARLLWGPPGTGKSRTLRAIVAAALVDAERRGVPQRILVTGPTYNAIDEVLTEAVGLCSTLVSSPIAFHRLRSSSSASAVPIPSTDTTGGDYPALRARLLGRSGLVVVGGTPQQVHRLLADDGGVEVAPLFDLILVDEASQVDMANAVLALAALAGGGSVVVAGDPLQMAPIHPAEPPRGLEAVVGSLYRYYKEQHGVPVSTLMVNYRSNRIIVDFAAHAGYEPGLVADKPDLRLGLVTPVDAAQPAGWPAAIPFSALDAEILDPGAPAVCFTYADGRSVQSNRFEADRVAALALLLRPRLADRLEGDGPPPWSATPYDEEGFWRRGLGIVTPHKAQQALIVSRLCEAFRADATTAGLIREAVDTVERFQGQQRDVMIASYAMGDPDAIGDEEEFLMSLNRFNVMASRARAKLIVLVSSEVVSHIPGEVKTMRESALLKVYAETFCNVRRAAALPAVDPASGAARTMAGILATRRA